MFSNMWMSLVGRETLIAADDTWGLLAVMCLGVFAAIWLEQKYQWASKISGAIIALILAMVMANAVRQEAPHSMVMMGARQVPMAKKYCLQ